MAAAAAYARRGLGQVWPNPAVGALIVRDDGGGARIVGRGRTQPPGGPHAEVVALRDAATLARGATCYVTLEPCSHQGRTGPCAVALAEAGIARVVIGLLDPNPRVSGRGVEMLRAGGVAVTTGVGAAVCAGLHAGHVRRVTEGRPHVILKVATSRDGFIGRPGGGKLPISGEDMLRQVHLLRAECDAIVVGIGTVLEDDPILNCRLPGLSRRSPVRVVLDTQARLPLGSRLVQSANEIPLWVVAGADAPAERLDGLSAAGVTVIRLATPAGRSLNIGAALRALGQRGLTRILVEGGAGISRAFVDDDLADEVWVSMGDMEIGAGGTRPFGDRGLGLIRELPRYRETSHSRVGSDTLITWIRDRS